MVRFAILFSNIFNFTPTSLFPTLHDDSEATLKTSFDENDSSLDRIGTFTIPPPNTVASTEDCLVHVKGVSCHDVQLLENEQGEVAIAALTGDIPGSNEYQPIVFTYARKLSDRTTESESPSFSKRLAAISSWSE